MLVVIKAQATPEQIQAVCEYIEHLGFAPTHFLERSAPQSALPATRVKWNAETLKNSPAWPK